ncbi:MAG: transposase [Eubacteriales bacterium]
MVSIRPEKSEDREKIREVNVRAFARENEADLVDKIRKSEGFVHHRRSIRLKGYDYSKAGYYFITICTKNRETLFGSIENGEMKLNEYGDIVREEWMKSSEIRREIELDYFIIMPDHIHGIVIINETKSGVGAHGHAPLHSHITSQNIKPLHRKPKSISSFVAGFKSIVTKRINILRNCPQMSVWQRGYYEHIVRSEKDLKRIKTYIIENLNKWLDDSEIK